ncbi:hypothetical protein OBBRIDRAFT_833283 [Obba rivulosa]|uniref:Queuosine 5'-phosphate N-glycosylase/hydrolase n=1 Tax=Obba rivulosa TaxID=1052685 RepID=A0A8E2DP20_9APHY|nr:hypothetical protein OBBRIDRAFT_833283 [Obba rivulosa]
MTVLARSLPSESTEDENAANGIAAPGPANPVVSSAEYALAATDLVEVSETGVKAAAEYIYKRLQAESYTPRTWRTHPLHLCPREPYSPNDPSTRACLDWIFLISSLNFSFWSEREGCSDRYGVEWREGWDSDVRKVHTGYWSMVAAVDRALEEGIPITDPAFYSSGELCSDKVIKHVFRPAPQCSEIIPLRDQRMAVMRENGDILCEQFGGSFQGFLEEFQRRHNGRGTALQLVQMVTDTFPSFRDESIYEGRRVYFWKRAQILVAETWAAFYPVSPSAPHPLFPHGTRIAELTMFADYRVPQILHHLRILTYPSQLVRLLRAHAMLKNGSREELSIRAASIVAVERVREAIEKLMREEGAKDEVGADVSSVLIDFYLWDLAKRIEGGEQRVEGIETTEILPAHRTRSIWY